MAKIAVQFWNVVCPYGRDLETLLGELSKLAPADRMRTESDGHLSLVGESNKSELWRGGIRKTQTSGLPPIVGAEGEAYPLNLKDKEGLGYTNAFLYHPRTRTLVWETNRKAVSAHRGIGYIFHHSGVASKPALRPILTKQAVELFTTSRVLKRVRLRFANIDGVSLLSQAQDNPELFNHFESLHEDYGAPNIELTLSVGRRKLGLLESIRKQLPKLLADFDGLGSLKTCEATVLDEDQKSTLIDLLSCRIKGEYEVEWSGRDEPDLNVRLGKLEASWLDKGSTIEELSPKPTGGSHEKG